MITRFTGDHAFLSNFYAHPFQLERSGHRFPTAEHAFQAAKASTVFEYQEILHAATPARAKQLGRGVQLPPWWEREKKRIMLEILLAKFRDPGLRDQLAATIAHELIEGNDWHDLYWGAEPYTSRSVGPMFEVADRSVWVGFNWLGRLLMATRDVLVP